MGWVGVRRGEERGKRGGKVRRRREEEEEDEGE